MHRSSSHIGSLQDYKPKSLWKSLMSKDSSSSSSSSSSTQSSGKAISRTLTRSSTMNVKRASMMISEPTQLRSTIASKRLSTYNLLNNCDLEVDPKERDLQSKTKSNRHTSMFLPSYHYEDNDDDLDSLHFIDMNATTTSTASIKDTNQETDSLSSALEDYKIFTKKTSTTTTPTKSEFNESITEARLSSLPSFSSTTTVDSQISVLHVSNSLWIGSTISDIDEEEAGLHSNKTSIDVDYFKDFDYEIFGHDVEEKIGSGCRTSLIFV